MKPQTLPSNNNPRAVPDSELPANENANVSGAMPAGGSGAVGDQASIKQAIEAKQLSDRFGLPSDLVLRNLTRLRQAAALENVQIAEAHKAGGNNVTAGNGQPNTNAATGGQPLSDEQMANIIFNETRSLSGENIDQVRYYLALAIFNAQSDSIYLRKRFPLMAKNTATVPKVEQATWDATLSAVSRAKADYRYGYDPTAGATHFNLRPSDSRDDFLGFHLRTQVGPLNNSFPTKELPASGVYVNTYGEEQ